MTRLLSRAAVLLVLAGPLTAQQAPTAPEVPAVPRAPLAPLAPLAMAPRDLSLLDQDRWRDARFAFDDSRFDDARAFTLGAFQRFPQDPADSLYREARTLLNRGEWRKAAALFAQIADRQPVSRYAPDALYWQAFALYRIGGTTELREALAALDTRRSRFPQASSASDSDALAMRISGALAARGDASARDRLARAAGSGGKVCDPEELSVRSSAMSALMRSDPDAAQPLLSKVLADRDECTVSLRKSAVMLIGTKGDASAKARLADVVKNDPSADVRGDAIDYLARVSGDEVVGTLEAVIANPNEDEGVQRAAVRALGDQESARAKAAIRSLVLRTSAPERLRLEALSTFDRGSGFAYSFSVNSNVSTSISTSCSGPNCPEVRVVGVPAMAPMPPAPPSAPRGVIAGGLTGDADRWELLSRRDESDRRLSADDAAWLRGVYPRLETTRLKSRAVAVLARSGDEATLPWLTDLVQREDEPADVRATVLSRLGRDLPIAQLNKFYDTASNRAVREQIVSVLGGRKEPEATDKLIDIVKNGTDPQLRRSAISALTRKDDPRTKQLLLDLIAK